MCVAGIVGGGTPGHLITGDGLFVEKKMCGTIKLGNWQASEDFRPTYVLTLQPFALLHQKVRIVIVILPLLKKKKCFKYMLET